MINTTPHLRWATRALSFLQKKNFSSRDENDHDQHHPAPAVGNSRTKFFTEKELFFPRRE